MAGFISHGFNNGRYGNELFQIASTVGIAELNGLQASFPYIRPDIIKYHSEVAQYLNNNFKEVYTHTEENRYNFYRVPVGNGCRLIGHFQSPKYWAENWEMVNSLFLERSSIGNYLFETYFKSGFRSQMTLLHVRRTDYLEHGWFVGKDYFQKVIDSMPNDYFFVCSDDVEWVRANLKMKNYIIAPEIKPEELLHLVIACCKKFVISNSTYSWWMAYLSQKTPEVYYPDYFVGNFPNRDLYPKTWNKISF